MLCPKCSTSLEEDVKFCATCGSEVDATPKDPFLGRILLNQYVIQRKLGEGGYGAVYEADQPAFRRKVAIKTLHKHLTSDPKVVKRFHREGMVASQLEQNPNAVKMLNVGETEDGYLWIAMEFIQGETLDDRIQKKPLSIQELLEIMGPVCNLLDEAHQKTIIHRDLKPDNIMLTHHQGKVVPKVLDFGIAGIVESDDASRPTKTGVVTGTPPYMPPEQWRGLKHTDHRSDIYALGVIVYECLSGKLPFDAETVPDWMIRHVMQEPKKLSEVMAGNPLPKNIEGAVMKALAKEPIDRYQSAGEFFRALAALGEKDTIADPASPTASRSPLSISDGEGQRVSPAAIATMPSADLTPAMAALRAQQLSSSSAPKQTPNTNTNDVPVPGTEAKKTTLAPLSPSSGQLKMAPLLLGAFIAVGALGYFLWPKNVAPSVGVNLPGSPLTQNPNTPAEAAKSWAALSSGTASDLYAIYGSNTDNIYAVGDDGTVARSTDGKTWLINQLELGGHSILGPGRPSAIINDVFVNEQREALMVHGGSLLRGQGDELTAINIPSRSAFRALWSAPDAPLILGGSDVYSSRDGVQWLRANGFGRRDEVFSVWGRDASFIVAVGQEGLLAISRDRGETWQRADSSAEVSFNDVNGDANNIYVVGDGGVFLAGDALGTSWAQQKTGASDSLQSVWVTSVGNIFVVGAQGTILFSKDKGKTWQRQESNTARNLYDIWGSPSDILYAVGEAGTILILQ